MRTLKIPVLIPKAVLAISDLLAQFLKNRTAVSTELPSRNAFPRSFQYPRNSIATEEALIPSFASLHNGA